LPEKIDSGPYKIGLHSSWVVVAGHLAGERGVALYNVRERESRGRSGRKGLV